MKQISSIVKQNTAWIRIRILYQGSFFNYVDQILPIIEHLPKYAILKLVKEFLKGEKICTPLTFPVPPNFPILSTWFLNEPQYNFKKSKQIFHFIEHSRLESDTGH